MLDHTRQCFWPTLTCTRPYKATFWPFDHALSLAQDRTEHAFDHCRPSWTRTWPLWLFITCNVSSSTIDCASIDYLPRSWMTHNWTQVTTLSLPMVQIVIAQSTVSSSRSSYRSSFRLWLWHVTTVPRQYFDTDNHSHFPSYGLFIAQICMPAMWTMVRLRVYGGRCYTNESCTSITYCRDIPFCCIVVNSLSYSWLEHIVQCNVSCVVSYWMWVWCYLNGCRRW